MADMERETIQKKMGEIAKKIGEVDSESPSFKQLTESYRNLMDAMIKDKNYEEARQAKDRELDFKKKEIDARIEEVKAKERMSKHSDIWGVVGGVLKTIGTGAATILAIWFVGRQKEKDDVFMDKDELRLATAIAPR